MGSKILVCEDERNIITFLKAELNRAGYRTDVAGDGEEAIKLCEEGGYDLMLLDLMLPRKNGLEVLRSVRKISTIPIIVLTARKDTFDKVLLLQSGADDYVTKPFDTLELLARIERNIQRSRQSRDLHVRDLKINYERFVCSVCGHGLPLTKTEFEVLFALCQNVDKVLSREFIAQRLYGEHIGDSNVVDVNIKNIRRKIAQLSEEPYIETVRGKGYVIRP